MKPTVYGASWCPDVKRSRSLLERFDVEYAYVDVEEDAEAEALVRKLQDGARRIPTIVFPDGTHLVEPTDEALTAHLGR